MNSSEEQRFDFEVEVVTALERRIERKSRPSDRTIHSTTAKEPASPGDEVSRVLQERIERLKRRAVTHEVEAPPDELSGAASPAAPNGNVREDPATDPEEVAASDTERSLSIAQFYAYLKQAIAGRFPGEIWVTGEIRSFRASNGHRFIELADQGADQKSSQQLEVCCWSQTWRSVESALAAAGLELEVGRVIRVLGRVSIWEAAGKIRFTLSRVDVEAMLGGIAAARQRLLRMLAVEGLLERNKALSTPVVPLRIGLVTSQGSEAHKDFVGQLERSGFAFHVELVHSLVQGAEAPAQIAHAISRLNSREVDLVVVARGGGSRNDLAAFDSEMVARAIATASIPVWIGVGHTGDHSVADEVAHRSFITPTACGEAVVAEVGRYWDEVIGLAWHLGGLVRSRLIGASMSLAHDRVQLARTIAAALAREEQGRVARRARVISAAAHLVRAQQADLERRGQHLARSVDRTNERFERMVAQRGELLRAFDPRRQLARGWAIVRDTNGETVRSVLQLNAGAEITARFADGEASAVVRSSRLDAEAGPSGGGGSQQQHEERT